MLKNFSHLLRNLSECEQFLESLAEGSKERSAQDLEIA